MSRALTSFRDAHRVERTPSPRPHAWAARARLPRAAAVALASLALALVSVATGLAPTAQAASPASGAAPQVTIMRPAHGATICAGKLDILVDVSAQDRLASEHLALDGVSVPFTTASDGPNAIDIGASIPVATGLHTLDAAATDANGSQGIDTSSFTAVKCAPGQTQPGRPTTTPTTVGGGAGTGGRPPATPGPGAAPTPANPNPNPSPNGTSPAAGIAFWLVVVSLFLLAVLIIAGLIALLRRLTGGANSNGSTNGSHPASPTPIKPASHTTP